MAMTLAPDPTANLVSDGDHLTKVAARLIRRRTRVGLYPVGEGSHTKAFRSVHVSMGERCIVTTPSHQPCEQVTIRPV